MAISDPLADSLTKIRNAARAKHRTVDVRASSLTQRVLEVLKQQGFITAYKAVGDSPSQRWLRVYLKYRGKIPAFKQLRRVSRPGMRRYANARTLPRVLRGLGVAVVSTSKGIMTEQEAYRQRIGGEVMCYVW
jgi:small subunit ribosomal protein S8